MDNEYERFSEIFAYDPDTGVITWKVDSGRYGRIKAGTVAGSLKSKNGYIEVHLKGKAYKAHRVAWLLHYGSWPSEQVDHINRNRSDNRAANLRACSASDNMFNKNIYKSNSSGIPGVSWHNSNKKWVCRIGVNGKRIHLGYWDSKDDAAAAYEKAKAEYHNF